MTGPGDGPARPGPGPGDGPGLSTPPRPADGSPAGGDTRPRRLAAEHGRSPWRTAFAVLAAAGLLGCVAWALLGSKLLVVRSVVVTGAQLVPAAQVRAAAGIPAGQPMIRVDTGAAARRVAAITQVRSAQVSRSWPDRIVITVRERTPVLAVALAGNGGYSLIDASGVAVRSVPGKPAGLPVYWPAAGSGPLRGSASVAAVAAVLRELPGPVARLAAVASASTPQNVIVGLSDGITIVWGDTSRAAAKAEELTALLGTHAHYYDVSAPGTAVTR